MSRLKTFYVHASLAVCALPFVACGGAPAPAPTPPPAPPVQVEKPAEDAQPDDSAPPVMVSEANAQGDLSTPEGLAAAVFEVLRSGDIDAANQLLVSTEDVKALCPNAASGAPKWEKILAEFGGELRRRWTKRIHKCRTAFDFSAAHIVEVKAKPVEKEGPKDCGAPVETIDDIKVVVQSSHRRYSFKIDDAVRTPVGWKSADLLRCPTSDEGD